MLNRTKRTAAIIVVIVSLLTNACADKLQSAINASQATAAALDAGIALVQEFQHENLLPPDKAALILEYATKGKIAVVEINQILKDSSGFDGTKKERVFALINRLLDGVEKFQAEGLLSFIGNQAKQDQIRKIVLAVRIALRGIEVYLSTQLVARIERLEQVPQEMYARPGETYALK